MKTKSVPLPAPDACLLPFTERCWRPPFTDYDDLDWPIEFNLIGQHRDPFPSERSEAECSHDAALCEIAKLSLGAQRGDTEAAEKLARVAFYATATLNRIAKPTPRPFAGFASTQHGWPVIKMRRETLSTSEVALFRGIKLGEASFIELGGKSAKWKMDEAGKMAYTLLHHIREHRRILNWPRKTRDKFRVSAWSAAVKSLPDFNDKTALEWWNLARTFILSVNPKPQNVRELNALVTSPTKRRTPAHIRAEILEILKARFLSFARDTPLPDLSRLSR